MFAFILAPNSLTLSNGSSNIALKNSVTFVPLSITNPTKSLKAILTTSNYVLKKSAAF